MARAPTFNEHKKMKKKENNAPLQKDMIHLERSP